MRLNYNSETTQSKRLGHGHAFISQIRQKNPDTYAYIKALSDTNYFEDGYYKYKERRVKIYNKFMHLLEKLIDNRWVSAFERDIKCVPYRINHLSVRVYKVEKVTWRTYREFELMIPQMESFIERRTRHE